MLDFGRFVKTSIGAAGGLSAFPLAGAGALPALVPPEATGAAFDAGFLPFTLPFSDDRLVAAVPGFRSVRPLPFAGAAFVAGDLEAAVFFAVPVPFATLVALEVEADCAFFAGAAFLGAAFDPAVLPLLADFAAFFGAATFFDALAEDVPPALLPFCVGLVFLAMIG